jgi:dipeptidase E
MKLYLSSYKLGQKTDQLKVLLSRASKKVAYISNALDWSSDLERRKNGEQSDIEQLESLGVGVELEKLDLREYFNKENELKMTIMEFGVIWVCGGNAFVLRQAMKLSGLDNILLELSATRADMLYGGYSAGVCVLGPTLRGIHIMDPPSERPYGDYATVWEGLGILDYVIVPHFESDHPDSEPADKAADYLRKHEIPFRTLRDGEVIIVDDQIELVRN